MKRTILSGITILLVLSIVPAAFAKSTTPPCYNNDNYDLCSI